VQREVTRRFPRPLNRGPKMGPKAGEGTRPCASGAHGGTKIGEGTMEKKGRDCHRDSKQATGWEVSQIARNHCLKKGSFDERGKGKDGKRRARASSGTKALSARQGVLRRSSISEGQKAGLGEKAIERPISTSRKTST